MSISRRNSVQVRIGQVPVGGDAPIVVQSMTNTDTADVEGTAEQVQALARAGSELVRITVNTDEAAAAVPPIRERLERARRARAADRRLPFQRPQAAERAPGLRRGARQVPHQSRQRRPRQQARPAVRGDDRDRLPLRQAGAHRRELGEPGPGSADAHDGRELAAAPSRWMPDEVMREAMVASALRQRASAPRSSACRTTASSSPAR